VIALDAETGRMLDYNQLVKHDAHDRDVDGPPALVVTRSGRAAQSRILVFGLR